MDAVEVWKVGLGLVVRGRRQQRALSQEAFAHDVGLTRNAIQKLERGGTNLSFESLLKVATALEVGPADLLREVEMLVSDQSLFEKALLELEDQRKKGRPLKVGL
ncbi:helix-turn-helix domain-containing protein [Acidovorax sp. BLS4]|uniref:helix-turn-helix domain-containing protein n=1 Tax=Acidovorax sp. BLS4 TaxID=3273430 RepID=UPI00355C72E1